MVCCRDDGRWSASTPFAMRPYVRIGHIFSPAFQLYLRIVSFRLGRQGSGQHARRHSGILYLTPSLADLCHTGMQVVETCTSAEVDVRLLGSVAVAITMEDSLSGRAAPPKDIDIVVSERNRGALHS